MQLSRLGRSPDPTHASVSSRCPRACGRIHNTINRPSAAERAPLQTARGEDPEAVTLRASADLQQRSSAGRDINMDFPALTENKVKSITARSSRCCCCSSSRLPGGEPSASAAPSDPMRTRPELVSSTCAHGDRELALKCLLVQRLYCRCSRAANPYLCEIWSVQGMCGWQGHRSVLCAKA